MQWTKRRAEKIVTRLLVTAILAIIAIEILVVVATIFSLPKLTETHPRWRSAASPEKAAPDWHVRLVCSCCGSSHWCHPRGAVRGGEIGGMRIGWRSARSARPQQLRVNYFAPSPCGSSPAAAISAASPSVPPAPDASIRRRSSASLGRSQKAATAVARSLNWPAVPRAQADIASSRAAAHWQQARTAMANGSSAFGALPRCAVALGEGRLSTRERTRSRGRAASGPVHFWLRR